MRRRPTKPNDAAKNLTKREFFSGLMLHATISTPYCSSDDIVGNSIKTADLLIKKLNEKPCEDNHGKNTALPEANLPVHRGSPETKSL